ncbi:MAG TPA: SDR family NAD(P)-dependent oxidoreductase [Acidimicrobiales bacterium]|jgi:NAD(P)-dependent dehydrogenase (short-subunit alcohol dehydrogenase family)
MQDLEGKVAVVTGGASGIGLALARRFAGERMRVVLADVERDALDKATAELADAFGADDVLGVLTDVRDDEAVDALAAAAFERFGTVHVLCNNAGVGVGGLTWTVPADRWRWAVDVNLLGVARGIRAFVPRMIEQGEGHVVNTASAAGILTGPAMAPYFATKHAVVALSESLYFDLQLTASAVGVSVLCPEWVRTNIADTERNRPEDVAAAEPAAVPGIDVDPELVRALIQGLIDAGIDPDEVAVQVVDAIRNGRFWVLTHPTTVESARQRWDAIAADGQPVLWNVTAG